MDSASQSVTALNGRAPSRPWWRRVGLVGAAAAGLNDTPSPHTLLKIGWESAMQATLNPVVYAPFASLLAGCAQEQLL
jgi:hypothetical protein